MFIIYSTHMSRGFLRPSKFQILHIDAMQTHGLCSSNHDFIVVVHQVKTSLVFENGTNFVTNYEANV